MTSSASKGSGHLYFNNQPALWWFPWYKLWPADPTFAPGKRRQTDWPIFWDGSWHGFCRNGRKSMGNCRYNLTYRGLKLQFITGRGPPCRMKPKTHTNTLSLQMANVSIVHWECSSFSANSIDQNWAGPWRNTGKPKWIPMKSTTVGGRHPAPPGMY